MCDRSLETAVRDALLRVADNVAKHTIQRSGWSADDTCFQVDLGEAERTILQAVAAELKEARHLLGVIHDVHSQHADDLCWIDIDRIFQAAGLPVPDRRVGDKFAMVQNCMRFIDTMCRGGHWKSYAELEEENRRLREALKPFADYSAAVTPGWPDSTGTSLLFKQPDGGLAHNPAVTLGHCRRAKEVLDAEGKYDADDR